MADNLALDPERLTDDWRDDGTETVKPCRVCADDSPPWFTGRWRDWHRGHGCNKDDGKPQSADAKNEIARRRGTASVPATTVDAPK